MDPAKAVGLFILFSGPCTPPANTGGSTPPPPIPSLGACPDEVFEGTVYAETLRMDGDDVVSIVGFLGCSDDQMRLCQADIGDGEPRVIELRVDYDMGHTECDRERARTLRAHAYDLRHDAFDDGVDDIEFWLHGLQTTYRVD